VSAGRKGIRLAPAAALARVATLASGCAVVSGFGLIARWRWSATSRRPSSSAPRDRPIPANGVLRPRRRRRLRPAAGRPAGEGRRRVPSDAHVGLPGGHVHGQPHLHRRAAAAVAGSRGQPLGGVHLADPELHGWQRPADRLPEDRPLAAPGRPTAAPSGGPVQTKILVGSRLVTPTAPDTRPVTCGSALTTGNTPDMTICHDGSGGFASARATSACWPRPRDDGPGRARVAGLPPPVRRHDDPAGGLQPRRELHPAQRPLRGDARLVPAADRRQHTGAGGDRRPRRSATGTYDVTLTARLGNGQARSATAKLTVRQAPAGGGGRPAARGGDGRPAQADDDPPSPPLGEGRPAEGRRGADRGHRGGDRSVVLRIARLRKGPYRVVIHADGRTSVRRAVLAR